MTALQNLGRVVDTGLFINGIYIEFSLVQVVNQGELMEHLGEVAESCRLFNRPYTATGGNPRHSPI